MNRDDSRRRFFVSPASFDNIGAVLTGMGEGFAHQVLSWGSLKKWQATSARDVLFLNCAMRFEFGYARKIGCAIKDFVAAGGTLYASDWALAAVRAAFPDMVALDSGGAKGHADCDVVDRGLQEMIGKRINVEFDLGAWRRLVRLDSSVHVHLAASGGGSAKASAGLPIVVGFRHGEGNVLCTSFHNKAQLSDAERRLLRFLVLQPILARAAAEATQAVAARQFQPGQQIFSTMNRGQTSPPFVFDASVGQGLLCSLNWSGAARLRLTIKNPTGTIHYDRARDQPPLGFEVARAAPGRWTCEIAGENLPHDNFPFVLTLATGSAAVSGLAPPRPGLNNIDVPASPARPAAAGFKVSPPPPPRSPTRENAPTAPPATGIKIPPPPPPRRPRGT